MNAWIWLAPSASFVGAGLAYLGAWAGTRQRERQGRREEWGRRFTAALTAMGGDEERARMIGRALLSELSRSEIASEEERRLADYLLQADADYALRGRAGPMVAPRGLDRIRVVRETEGSGGPPTRSGGRR